VEIRPAARAAAPSRALKDRRETSHQNGPSATTSASMPESPRAAPSRLGAPFRATGWVRSQKKFSQKS